MVPDSTYQRLNELHAIVLRRVVGRCDHDADPFALQCPRSEGGDKTNACENRVQDIAAAVSFTLVVVALDMRMGASKENHTLWYGTVHEMVSLVLEVP